MTRSEAGGVDPSTPDADAQMEPGDGALAAPVSYAPAITGTDALAIPSEGGSGDPNR